MRSRLHALYPALSALPEVQQDRLFAADNLLQLPAGAAIFSENQPCGGFPLILEGSIKVIKQASNGREFCSTGSAPVIPASFRRPACSVRRRTTLGA